MPPNLLSQTGFVTNNRLPNSTIEAEADEKNKTSALGYKPNPFLRKFSKEII